MNLTDIPRQRLRTGLRFVFYGVESVGKSTLAAHAPEPIFLDIENGTGQLEVARYPFPHGTHVPRNYEEVITAIDAIRINSHGFKTLVIDTIDALEGLIWSHVCAEASYAGKSYKSIEDFGYGKGYGMALDTWRWFVSHLENLRNERDMNIILLGHCHVRPFRNPEGEDFDRYQLRLHEKSAGLIKGWCDVLGFLRYEEIGAKPIDDGKRVKGYSTGRRLIQLTRTAAYDAKSRLALPGEIELSTDNPWRPFALALAGAADATPESLKTEIDVELQRIGDAELSAKVFAAVTEAGNDLGRLSRYLQELRKRAQQ